MSRRAIIINGCIVWAEEVSLRETMHAECIADGPRIYRKLSGLELLSLVNLANDAAASGQFDITGTGFE